MNDETSARINDLKHELDIITKEKNLYKELFELISNHRNDFKTQLHIARFRNKILKKDLEEMTSKYVDAYSNCVNMDKGR